MCSNNFATDSRGNTQKTQLFRPIVSTTNCFDQLFRPIVSTTNQFFRPIVSTNCFDQLFRDQLFRPIVSTSCFASQSGPRPSCQGSSKAESQALAGPCGRQARTTPEMTPTTGSHPPPRLANAEHSHSRVPGLEGPVGGPRPGARSRLNLPP